MTASISGPGCQGPLLAGTASPALILATPAAVTVTATVTANCAGPVMRHVVACLNAPNGWTVSPPGAIALPDLPVGASATARWRLNVPAGAAGSGLTAQAIYDVGPHSADSTQAQIAASVAYPSVAAAFDNVGITSDSDTGPGDLDGSGYSLSAQALTAAGYPPGTAITHAGLTFTWPDAAAGQQDNITAGGQAIVAGTAGSTLGFLVTGSYGPASGTGTVLYSDGGSQPFTLTAPDWYATPPAGTDVVFTLPYRNAPGNTQDQHQVAVFYAGVALEAGKTVQAVVLPDVSSAPPAAGSPALHVFAMTIG